MMILFLAVGAQGFSTESSEDGELLANLTLYISILLLVTMLGLSLFSNAKKPVLGGLIWLILFLQYSRWTILIDYRSSPFAESFWRRVNYLFDRYELWESSRDAPDQKFQDLGISTSDFMSNAEEQLIVLFLCLLLSFVFYFILPRSYVFCSSVIGWGFLVIFTDVLLFALIQFQGTIDLDSLVNLLNFAAAVLLMAVYLCLFILTLFKVCKGNLRNLSLFTSEFRENHMYYPLIILTRGAAMALYVFTPYYGTLQEACLAGFELLLFFYLMLTFPYKRKINNVFGILYHLAQGYIVSMPYLYEKDYLPEMNSTLVFSVWGLLFICFVRAICDCFQKVEKMGETKINPGEPEMVNNGNSDAPENPKVADETFFKSERVQMMKPIKMNTTVKDNHLEQSVGDYEKERTISKPATNNFFRNATQPLGFQQSDRVVITRSSQASNIWRKLPDLNKITVRKSTKD